LVIPTRNKVTVYLHQCNTWPIISDIFLAEEAILLAKVRNYSIFVLERKKTSFLAAQQASACGKTLTIVTSRV
jgi:hypothetical protein